MAKAAFAAFAGAAGATDISWADLTSTNADGTLVAGSISIRSGSVDFTMTSDAPVGFVTINNGGTNFWTNPAFTSNGAYNQPQTSDIVALNAANTETITFSQRSPTSIWRSTAGTAPTPPSVNPLSF